MAESAVLTSSDILTSSDGCPRSRLPRTLLDAEERFKVEVKGKFKVSEHA